VHPGFETAVYDIQCNPGFETALRNNSARLTIF